MKTFLGILVAVLAFGVMIFFHEFGHYIVARLCKVKVLEFAIGMGPKLFSRTSKKTGIKYSLRALPIGGFTAMQGEDGEDDDPHALVNRPRWQRFLVLFAGSFMNILTGFIAMFVFLCITWNTSLRSNVILGFYQENGSSQYLQAGDAIVAIEGAPMIDYTDIFNTITYDGTEPLDVTVIRDGEKTVIPDVVFPTQETSGLLLGECDIAFEKVQPTPWNLISQTFTQSLSTVRVIYKTLGKLITGKFGIKAVSGPVGTVSTISEVAQADNGWKNVLYLFIFISINLGIMNLLPLPALDGGRIVFLLVEAVIRRRIPAKVESYIHLFGMVLLFAFMIFITVFDVIKLFH